VITLRSLLPSRTGPPQVRAATTADAAALALIHAGAFHRGWDAAEFERLLADRCAHAHVLHFGATSAPQGFILSHLVPPEAEILSIALAGPVRGKGLFPHPARTPSRASGRLPGAAAPIWRWRRTMRPPCASTAAPAMSRWDGARGIMPGHRARPMRW